MKRDHPHNRMVLPNEERPILIPYIFAQRKRASNATFSPLALPAESEERSRCQRQQIADRRRESASSRPIHAYRNNPRSYRAHFLAFVLVLLFLSSVVLAAVTHLVDSCVLELV
jgi:hypothetical protein